MKFAPADQHLCPNLDFTADIYAYREQVKGGGLNVGEPQFYAKGEWFWVNLSSWGSCLGDYGGKYQGYENEMSAAQKNRIGDLSLKNIKPKDSPSRDYEIENALGGKAQRPLEAFKDVKQVTENLKSEAQSAAANITSFSDRTHLAEAQKLYQKALADEPNNSHAANQLKRVEWILKHYGVEINGVTWAISNVGKPGEFVENPEDYGGYYTWQEAINACPEGWRLATEAELENLVKSTNGKWTEKGYEYANGKLFLPAAGYAGKHGKVGVGWRGCYWSSSKGNWGDDSYHYLFFSNQHNIVLSNWGFTNRAKEEYKNNDETEIFSTIGGNGFSVRCVLDNKQK